MSRPSPNRITGPNSGSTAAPRNSSRAYRRGCIRCTLNPVTSASGLHSATRATMLRAASSTASTLSSDRANPPTSRLRRILGARIATSTGNPSVRAIRPACSGVSTTWMSPTGIP